MRENAFVEAWKTQHRRVSMILGLTLLCAPSAISVYAENGVNDITVQAVMQTKTVKGTVLDENGEPLIGVSIVVKGTSTGTITDFAVSSPLIFRPEVKNWLFLISDIKNRLSL